jgi:hypothetical protein
LRLPDLGFFRSSQYSKCAKWPPAGENDWASDNRHEPASRLEAGFSKRGLETFPIRVILEDGFTPIPAIRQMINRAQIRRRNMSIPLTDPFTFTTTGQTADPFSTTLAGARALANTPDNCSTGNFPTVDPP